MTRLKRLCCSGALACALALPSLLAAETLKTGGTGAAIGTMLALAEAYRKKEPSFQLSVVPHLGSNGGMKAVAAGAIDFAVIGRELKPEEQAAGMTGIMYGQTPLVVVTNKDGVKSLSRAQLASLIGNADAKWFDGTPVRLVLRPAVDTETLLLGEFAPEIKQALALAHARPGMVRAASDQESADQSERLPGSLGTSSLSLIRAEKRALQIVDIDGVQPSVENLRRGVYPYGKFFMLVTKGVPSAAAQRFIQFIGSEEGREVLLRLGHLVGAHR